MPGIEYSELYNELSEKENKSPELQAYLKSMKALDEKMTELSKLDKWGIPKKLEGKELTGLLVLYGETAQKAETYFKSAPEDQAERDLAKRLTGLMNRDLQGLLEYRETLEKNPKAELESLPTLIEKARIPTIDLSSIHIDPKHGRQSERLPMEVTVNGKTMQGMFTKESRVDFQGLGKVLERNAEKLAKDRNDTEELEAQYECEFKVPDDLGAPVRGLLDCYRAYMRDQNARGRGNYPIYNDDRDFISFRKMLVSEQTPMQKVTFLRQVLKYGKGMNKDHENTMFYKAEHLATLARELEDVYGRYVTYHNVNKIAGNSRVDDRNAAMSSVASLLGVSNLLCKSVTMRYRDEKGNLVNGTMMEMSKGVDCQSPYKQIQGTLTEDSLDEPKVMKDLANLQALDYICGNTDRHGGNMMFIVEDGKVGDNGKVGKAKITGVQGIDNDLSFGPSTFEKGMSHLTLPANMRVIGEDMAKRIEALTPEQLKFALRQYSLSEEELDSAAQRLKIMQDHLAAGKKHYRNKPAPKSAKDCETGYIRILSDEDFKQMKAEELMPNRDRARPVKSKGFQLIRNIFYYAISNIQKLLENLLPKKEKTQNLAKVASRNRATRESAEAQYEAAYRFVAELDELDPEGKEQNGPLYQAVNRFRDFQKKLNQRLHPMDAENPFRAFDAAVGPTDLENMKDELLRLQQGAEEHKKQFKGKPDPYEGLTKDILSYTEQMLNVPPELEKEEKQTAIDNERRAMERFNTGLYGETMKLKKDLELKEKQNVKQEEKQEEQQEVKKEEKQEEKKEEKQEVKENVLGPR